MITDLERFAGAFSSESDLRRYLEMLLAKMPNITGVKHIHGQQEYGKDLIFYGIGSLGERKLHACVVKNGRISGTVDSDSGARTVLNQAEQALDTPYTNEKGLEEQVEAVYIMTPHECSQSALNSIKGKLKQRAGQVTFIYGRSLFDLFSKYWPDFLLFESNLLTKYAASLHAGVQDTSFASKIAFRYSILSEAWAELGKSYVRPSFQQRLHKFKLAYKLSTVPHLANPLSQQEIQAIQADLEKLSAMLRSISDWFFDDVQTSTTIDNVMKQFLKSWNIGFASKLREIEENRRKQQAGLDVPQKEEDLHAIKIIAPLAPQIQPKLEELFQEAATIFEKFTKTLDDANSFSDSTYSSDLICLPQSILYCKVQAMAQQVPELIYLSSTTSILQYGENILDEYRYSLVITGAAGFGKTSFCKWNAVRDLEKLARGQSSRLPIYIPLHRCAQASINSFEHDLIGSEVEPLLRKHQSGEKNLIRIYLDGLDEVASIEQRFQIINLIRGAIDNYPDIQFVITAREYVLAPWLMWLPRVEIREFDDDQLDEFISKILKREAIVEDFWRQLQVVPSLKPLLRIPLLATLIVAVYRKQHSLPENRIQLYQIVLELLCGGWDFARGVNRGSKFTPATKMRVLTRIAGFLHFARKREGSNKNFKRAVRDVVPALSERWEIILHEIFQDGILVLAGMEFAFSHLSFQEFLTSRDINDPTGKRPQMVLRWFLMGEDWWKTVLELYLSQASNPRTAEDWLYEVFQGLDRNASSKFGEIRSRFDHLLRSLFHVFPGYENDSRQSVHIRGEEPNIKTEPFDQESV